jgi:hypothetical protein
LGRSATAKKLLLLLLLLLIFSLAKSNCLWHNVTVKEQVEIDKTFRQGLQKLSDYPE